MPIEDSIVNESFIERSPPPPTRTTRTTTNDHIRKKRKPFKKIILIGLFVALLMLIVFLIIMYVMRDNSNKQKNNSNSQENKAEQTAYKQRRSRNYDQCMLNYGTPKIKYVVNGDLADRFSYPFNVFFTYRFGVVDIGSVTNGSNTTLKDIRGECGGILIDKRAILTVAHCLRTQSGTIYYDPNNQKLFWGFHETERFTKVYIGLNNLKPTEKLDIANLTESDRFSRRKIKRVFIHEDYDPITNENDIALIELNEEIKLNEYKQVACLPTAAESGSGAYPSVYDQAILIGWGRTQTLLDYFSLYILRTAKLSVLDNSNCIELFKNYNRKKQICVGDPQGESQACFGDSGGGLFKTDRIGGQQKPVLAGLVSYGANLCDDATQPEVYTRVSYYLDWIEEKLNFIYFKK